MGELYYCGAQGNRVWYQLKWLWFMLSGRLWLLMVLNI